MPVSDPDRAQRRRTLCTDYARSASETTSPALGLALKQLEQRIRPEGVPTPAVPPIAEAAAIPPIAEAAALPPPPEDAFDEIARALRALLAGPAGATLNPMPSPMDGRSDQP